MQEKKFCLVYRPDNSFNAYQNLYPNSKSRISLSGLQDIVSNVIVIEWQTGKRMDLQIRVQYTRVDLSYHVFLFYNVLITVQAKLHVAFTSQQLHKSMDRTVVF